MMSLELGSPSEPSSQTSGAGGAGRGGTADEHLVARCACTVVMKPRSSNASSRTLIIGTR
jgi:hypothetical protein